MVYPGSKSRIAKHILPIVLTGREPDQWYVEPFCGGCNMIDKVDGKRMANDVNKYLIAFLKALVNNGFDTRRITKEEYTDIRSDFSKYPDELVGYASCFGFRGVFGSFVSYAPGRDYQAERIKNINKQTESLRGIEFTSGPYDDMEIPKNSLIYCDPPYHGTRKDSYAPCEFDHTRFWRWCREKKKEGHTVFVSEQDAPSDFSCVFEKRINTGFGVVRTEKLFTI